MHKDNLKGKYVLYSGLAERCKGWRLGKVTKITGNTLTIKDAYKEKHRIHTKTHKIFGVLTKKKIRGLKLFEYTEEIEWN